MIKRATDEEIKKYRDDPSLNQSLLKTLYIGPEAFNPDSIIEGLEDYEKRDKRQFILGSGAELLATYGEEVFKEKYYVTNITKMPSDAVVSIWRTIHKEAMRLEHPIEDVLYLTYQDFKKIAYEAINKVGFFMNRFKEEWREDNRFMELLKPENKIYWDALLLCGDKQEISTDEEKIIRDVAANWVTKFPTADVFKEDENIDIYYQFPIYFMLFGISCKALLDMVVINKRLKTIQAFDLKTTAANTRRFKQSVRQFKYYIQAAFYNYALREKIKGKALEQYTMLPFTFIVESTTYPGIPLLYPMDQSAMELGCNGLGERSIKQTMTKFSPDKDPCFEVPKEPIKGVVQLMEDLKWYQENGFGAHIDVVSTGGNIPITLTDLI